MKQKELLEKLKDLKRDATEEKPGASVSEAIETLIYCCEYLLSYQPERSKREDLMNFKDTEIKLPKEENLYINFDILKDIEVVRLKRNGRTISFPIWEFWQTLEKYNDCDGCNFY